MGEERDSEDVEGGGGRRKRKWLGGGVASVPKAKRLPEVLVREKGLTEDVTENGKVGSEAAEDPLAYYKRVKAEKVALKKARKERQGGAGQREEQEEEGEGEDGKRAITYQIARNKGLTPQRKKELRNPRVRHRKKYKKAIIKRKSQV